ncbi:hypothetical protein [Streptomyces sp. NPDC126499]|uniref:hypothetical protein n=1 Tax=Streptomyces sp. NPDC126499 TaxID=3155314 RepID=UPI00333458E8
MPSNDFLQAAREAGLSTADFDAALRDPRGASKTVLERAVAEANKAIALLSSDPRLAGQIATLAAARDALVAGMEG